HDFTASQRGQAGNQSLTSAVASVTVDTVHPTSAVPAEVVTNANAAGNQVEPSILPLADGGYMILWNGATLQRYDSTGNPVGSPFTNRGTERNNAAVDPAFAVLTNGNIALATTETSTLVDTTGYYTDVYVQVLSPTGGLVTPAPVLVSSAPEWGFNEAKQVVALDNGGFAVAWSTRGSANVAVDPNQVRMQVFSAAGARVGNEVNVGSAGGGALDYPIPGTMVATTGGFIVTWTASNPQPDYNVWAQRYTNAGAPTGTPIQLNATAAGDQKMPQIALLDGGTTFVAAWHGPGDGSGTGIYFRRFTLATGAALDATDRLANETTLASQDFQQIVGLGLFPNMGLAITALDGGGFVIAWTSQFQDGSGYGVFMRAFDTAGNATTGDILVNSENQAADQTWASIAQLNDGRLAVTWQSSVGDGLGSGIMQSLFTIDDVTGAITPAHIIAHTLLSEDVALGKAEVNFGTAYAGLAGVTPEFRLNGRLVTYGEIESFYGIHVDYNDTTGMLTLTNPASAADYQAVLRMLTSGATATVNGGIRNDVTLAVYDQAENQPELVQTITGIQVVPPSPPFQVNPTQVVTITGLRDDVGATVGIVAQGGATDDQSLLVEGTINLPLGAGQRLEVFDGGTSVGFAEVDATPQANGSFLWRFQDPRFATGLVSFTAQVVDITGGSGPLSTPARTATISAVPPPLITELQDNYAPYLGSVKDEGGTNDNRPVVNGTSTSLGATIAVYDGAVLLGTTVAATTAGGAWSLQTPVNLEEGVHELTAAYVLTVDGGLGAPSDTFTFTLDRTAPLAPVLSKVSGATVELDDGATTKETAVSLSGTAENGVTVSVYDGPVLLGTTVASTTDGTWSYDAKNLLDGGHGFYTVALDSAGNPSPNSNGIAIGVNTSPVDTKNSLHSAPIITGILDNVGLAQGEIRNGATTDDPTPRLHGVGAQLMTLSGQEQIFGTVNIYDNGTKIGSTIADASGAWSFEPTITVNGSSHVYTATQLYPAFQSEPAGESQPSGAWQLKFDPAPPATPSITKVLDNVVPNFGPIAFNSGTPQGLTNDASPVLVGSGTANSTISITDSAHGLLGTTMVDGSGTWAFNIVIGLDEGAHALKAQAVNAAGAQSGISTTANIFVDTVAPGAPAILTLGTDSGLPGFTTDGMTNDNTQAMTGTAEALSTITVYDGVRVIGTAVADDNGDGKGDWNFTTTPLADGPHNFTATASDAAGNASRPSEARSVTIDTTAPLQAIGDLQVNSPQVTNQSDVRSANLVGGGYVNVWVSADQDGSGFGVYMQRYDTFGRPVGEEARISSATALDQTLPRVAGLQDGSFVVTWTSTLQAPDSDLAGVFMRRFDANGTPLDANDVMVNTYTAGNQDSPVIGALNDGSFVIAWNSQGQRLVGTVPESGYSVYMQRFGADGGKLGTETLVNTTANQNMLVRDIIPLTTGGFVVDYWATASTPTGGRYKGYNADGSNLFAQSSWATPLGGGNVINSDFQGVALPNGGFALQGATWHGKGDSGWQDYQTFTTSTITNNAAVLPANARLTWLGDAALGDNTATVPPPTAVPMNAREMVLLENGNVAMVATSGNNVRLLIYPSVDTTPATGGANGTPLISNLLLNIPNGADSREPSIIARPGGGFILSWETNLNGTYDIVQHMYTAAGVRIQQITELNLTEANDLTQATVGFGATFGALAADPLFRSGANTYTVAQFNANASVNRGLQASWDNAGGVLTLNGAASAADYQAVLHLLTAGYNSGAPVTIQTRDLANNASATLTNIIVDPVAGPIIGKLVDDVPTLTGAIVANTVSNDATPLITGTGGVAGGSVRLFDGAAVLGNTVADANGNWSFQVTTALGNTAAHTITAAAVDAAGNLAPASVGFTFTVNTAQANRILLPEGAEGTESSGFGDFDGFNAFSFSATEEQSSGNSGNGNAEDPLLTSAFSPANAAFSAAFEPLSANASGGTTLADLAVLDPAQGLGMSGVQAPEVEDITFAPLTEELPEAGNTLVEDAPQGEELMLFSGAFEPEQASFSAGFDTLPEAANEAPNQSLGALNPTQGLADAGVESPLAEGTAFAALAEPALQSFSAASKAEVTLDGGEGTQSPVSANDFASGAVALPEGNASAVVLHLADLLNALPNQSGVRFSATNAAAANEHLTALEFAHAGLAPAAFNPLTDLLEQHHQVANHG
ncbi:MAG: Ig-like domain-containing protein, partial [Pseudomonadales bacterium]|nr:Ig-like domain-containing protein [Pseudomonadales bacterium]